ncbi:MAG TPA: hypothetical protein VGI64_21225 [Streptosporangiaceae bacterium]
MTDSTAPGEPSGPGQDQPADSEAPPSQRPPGSTAPRQPEPGSVAQEHHDYQPHSDQQHGQPGAGQQQAPWAAWPAGAQGGGLHSQPGQDQPGQSDPYGQVGPYWQQAPGQPGPDAQPADQSADQYGQPEAGGHGQPSPYRQPGQDQPAGYGQRAFYGQAGQGQAGGYGNAGQHGQPGPGYYGQHGPGQAGGQQQAGGYGQPGQGQYVQPGAAGGYGTYGGAPYGGGPYGGGPYGSPYGGYGQGGQQGWWLPAAAAPGGVPLRPLGLGDILSGAFTIVRRNPVATLGLAAIVLTALTTVLTLLLAPLQVELSRAPNSTALASFSFAALLSGLLSYGVGLLLLAMLSAVIGGGVLGRRLTLGEAWRAGLPRMPAVLGAVVLVSICVIGAWALWFVIILGLAAAHLGAAAAAVGIPGFLFLFCATAFVWIRFNLAGAAIVLERAGPLDGLRRSWRLTENSFWRVLGILLLSELIVGAVDLVLRIPFLLVETAARGGLTGNGPGTGLSLVTSAVSNVVSGTITWPLLAGVVVLLYIDLRIRREGLDLVLTQTAQAGPGGLTGDEFATAWRPPAGPPGAPAGPAAW